MQIDLNYLRRHYASLSDDALCEIDGTELVEEARRIYAEELAQRKLAPQEKKGSASQGRDVAAQPLNRPDDDESLDEEPDDRGSGDLDEGPDPDWLGDAAVAASFVSRPGGEGEEDAIEARDTLEAAGIPCHLSMGKVEPPRASAQQHEFRLMVPSKLNLEAESVLDKEIFNREIEARWRAHFQMLSDEELRALDLQVLFAGLTDRIERMTRAYQDELGQRESE